MTLVLLFNFINVLYGYPLHGVLKYNFKRARIKHNMQDLLQIHHIIPRQFKNHPAVKGVDLED